MRTLLISAFLSIILASSLTAQNRSSIEKSFQTWLLEEVWPRAEKSGVSQSSFNNSLKGVTLNWKLPDLIPPGQSKPASQIQRQAEFGSPERYFRPNTVISASKIGKQMAKRFSSTLRKVEENTGVPAHIILAIWGRESAYGNAKIPYNAFQVLSTKAFMSTRASYFEEELIAALQIVEQGTITANELKSSWAGALGQPQFMPRNFLKFAADGNADGSFDIWHSEEDTIASIGNFLAKHHWQKTRDWGFEVDVPTSVSCSLEGPDQGRSISKWVEMGVNRVSGKAFPVHELEGFGFLMMPAGRLGPAFIVTPNFYVLKEYNKSDLYALFVGHVGDRIAYNVGEFKRSWASQDKLLRGEVADMQNVLVDLGHDVGGADGLVGFKTRRSIGRWQQEHGEAETCFPDKNTVLNLTENL